MNAYVVVKKPSRAAYQRTSDAQRYLEGGQALVDPMWAVETPNFVKYATAFPASCLKSNALFGIKDPTCDDIDSYAMKREITPIQN